MSAPALIKEAEPMRPVRVKKRKLVPPRADGLKHKEAAMLDIDVSKGRVGVVYFISNPETQTIKVGFTTDLTRRLRELRGASGADIHAHAGFCAPRSLERLLHKKLKMERVRNEWFKHSDRIEDLIEAMEDYEIWHGIMTGDYEPMFGSEAVGKVLKAWRGTQ